MSNSLPDDLITPSHLATRAWDVARKSDENVTEEAQTQKRKTSRFLKESKQEELPSTEKQNPAKSLDLSRVFFAL